MPFGVYRRVFYLGPFAVKVPRLRQFAGGLRSNRWEREMWRKWQPVFGWETLCPVLFADPAGFVVVMPRATQPVDDSEVEALPDDYPGTTAESKSADHGRLHGRVVAVDYGIPHAEDARHRRDYYASFVAENRPHFSSGRDT